MNTFWNVIKNICESVLNASDMLAVDCIYIKHELNSEHCTKKSVIKNDQETVPSQINTEYRFSQNISSIFIGKIASAMILTRSKCQRPNYLRQSNLLNCNFVQVSLAQIKKTSFDVICQFCHSLSNILCSIILYK